MSKDILSEHETCKNFDCSSFLSQRLHFSSRKLSFKSANYDYHLDKPESDSVVTTNQAAIGGKNEAAFLEEAKLDEQYYRNEYNILIDSMDKVEFSRPELSEVGRKCDETHQIVLLDEEANGSHPTCKGSLRNDCQAHSYLRDDQEIIVSHPSKFADISVLKESFQTEKTFRSEHNSDSTCTSRNMLLRNICNQKSDARGRTFNPEYEKLKQQKFFGVNERGSLCRYFLNGSCVFGESCKFSHDMSVNCNDDQQVFLGGLPLWLTPMMLKTKLGEIGFTVLNYPKVIRGFCPELCLGSIQEAMVLIVSRYINIDGRRVVVRPYQKKHHLRDGISNLARRSVFLDGLCEKTTGNMIIDDLWYLGARVVEYPAIKKGYASRIVLGSPRQAKMLVNLKRVIINSAVVDVRPTIEKDNKMSTFN